MPVPRDQLSRLELEVPDNLIQWRLRQSSTRNDVRLDRQDRSILGFISKNTFSEQDLKLWKILLALLEANIQCYSMIRVLFIIMTFSLFSSCGVPFVPGI